MIRIERQSNEAGTEFQVTQLSHTKFNKIATITEPLSRTTTFSYDLRQSLKSTLDAEGNLTQYQYDERNLLFTVTDANTPAGVTRYDYDDNRNLAKIIDAETNPTVYEFDGFDRLQKTTYADTRFSQYSYDKNSNLIQHITPGTKTINYAYDPLNRLTAKTYPETVSLNTTYTYDLGSRSLTANNGASRNSYTYDELNRVITNTQSVNGTSYTLTYAYDNTGNQTQTIYPSGKNIEYEYDANDRLDIIKENTVNLIDYDYDLLNRRSGRSFINTNLPAVTYAYDNANQLTTIHNQVFPSTNVSQYSYTHDNAGNRLTMTAPDGTHNYTYNNIYELTSVSGAQTHNYAYDSVGNRNTTDSVSYTSNNLNQYTQVGMTNYSHDTNGNLTGDGTNTYTYDEENRPGTMSNATNSASYTYDAFNRRVSKTVNGNTTYFIYDNDEVIAEYNSSGGLGGCPRIAFLRIFVL